MDIRDARAEDADAACQVMRRSIMELCLDDHRQDPLILQRWLANKTPDIFKTWLDRRDNTVLVAVENGTILAVGSVTDAGVIDLNYVSPDARFQGVSHAMLSALEARALARGNSQCRLTSTVTARRFYEARGYVRNGPPVRKFGIVADYPMIKRLTPPHP